jgi:GntR family transcriptional regulator
VKIDPNNHVPIFLQIVEQIAASIAAGVFRPGESLPAQRSLAVSLGVNPNTVQKALDELERRGLVVSRRGVGMFVTDRGNESALTQTEEVVAEAFRRGLIAARESNLTGARMMKIFENVLLEMYESRETP